MSRVKIRQFGLDEMDATFRNLTAADQKKIIQKSLKNSVFPMESIMRRNARRTRNNDLVNSIGSVQMRKLIGMKVGARIDKGFKGRWGYILDVGTKERKYFTKRGVVHPTGKIKKYSWFTDAVETTADHCSNLLIGEHYNVMQKLMVSNVRKINKEFVSQQ